jgi:hypothetical protein
MRTAFSSDSQQSAVESEGDYFQDDFYDWFSFETILFQTVLKRYVNNI